MIPAERIVRRCSLRRSRIMMVTQSLANEMTVRWTLCCGLLLGVASPGWGADTVHSNGNDEKTVLKPGVTHLPKTATKRAAGANAKSANKSRRSPTSRPPPRALRNRLKAIQSGVMDKGVTVGQANVSRQQARQVAPESTPDARATKQRIIPSVPAWPSAGD